MVAVEHDMMSVGSVKASRGREWSWVEIGEGYLVNSVNSVAKETPCLV